MANSKIYFKKFTLGNTPNIDQDDRFSSSSLSNVEVDFKIAKNKFEEKTPKSPKENTKREDLGDSIDSKDCFSRDSKDLDDDFNNNSRYCEKIDFKSVEELELMHKDIIYNLLRDFTKPKLVNEILILFKMLSDSLRNEQIVPNKDGDNSIDADQNYKRRKNIFLSKYLRESNSETISSLLIYLFACRGEEDSLCKLLTTQNLRKKFGLPEEETNFVNLGERVKRSPLETSKLVESYYKTRTTETLNKILCFFSNKEMFKKIPEKLLGYMDFSIMQLDNDSVELLLDNKNYVLIDVFFKLSKRSRTLNRLQFRFQKYKIISKVILKEMNFTAEAGPSSLKKLDTNNLEVDESKDSPEEGDNKLQMAQKRLIKYCINEGCEKLASMMIKRSPLNIEETDFEIMIAKKRFRILAKLLKKSKEYRMWFTKKKLLERLLTLLEKQVSISYVLNFLYILRKERFEVGAQIIICNSFKDMLLQLKFSLFDLLSPVHTTLMISYILVKLSYHNSAKYLSFRKLSRKYKKLAISIIKDIKNMSVLKSLMMSSIFPYKKSLIGMLLDHKQHFEELLGQENILKVLYVKWNSSYRYDYNLWAASTSLLLIRSSHLKMKKRGFIDDLNSNWGFQKKHLTNSDGILSQKQNEVKRSNSKKKKNDFVDRLMTQIADENSWSIFKYISASRKKQTQKNNHFYQYVIFVKSVKLRETLELLFVVGFFFLVFFILLNKIEKGESLLYGGDRITFGRFYWSEHTEYSDDLFQYSFDEVDMENTRQILKDLKIISVEEYINTYFFMKEYKEKFYENLAGGELLSSPHILLEILVLVGSASGLIFQKWYEFLLYEKINFQMKDILDMVIILFTIPLIPVQQFLWPSPLISDNDKFTIIRATKIVSSLILFALVLKIPTFMKVSKSIGLLVKIIELLIMELLNFFALLFLYLFFFIIMLHLFFAFYDENYSSLWEAFKTSIKMLFNNVDWGDLEQIQTFQNILIICFLFLFSVIMVNLLVAILSNTHQRFMDRSNMEYGKIVYESYMSKKFDKNLGSLNLLPAPFNICMPILLIFLSLWKSKKLNKIFSKFLYACYLALLFVIFAVSDLVLAFFAWIRVSLIIFLGSYIMNHRKIKIGFAKRVAHLFSWVILGLPYIFAITLTLDFPHFFKSGFECLDNRNIINAPNGVGAHILKKMLIRNFNHEEDIISVQVFKNNLKSVYKNMKETARFKKIKKNHVSKGNIKIQYWKNNNYESQINDFVDLVGAIEDENKQNIISMQRIRNYFKEIKVTKKNSLHLRKTKDYYSLLKIIHIFKEEK